MDLESQVALLPDRPGIYIYRDTASRVLYVGKARSLKNRVKQYFQASRNLPPKVQLMVPQIARIEHIVTDTEVEALILESNLIKRFKPKYNIRLRDDKHYPYLRLTLHEQWPRLLIARQMRKDGSRYFGPYTTSGVVYETLKLMRRLFPLRTCSDPAKHPRACLQYHIGRCLGPCLRDFSHLAEYEQAVKDVAVFLEGQTDPILKRLRSDMAKAAEALAFERAAELRDRIRALEKVSERQKVISHHMADQDIIGYAGEHDDACIQVFFVRQGKLVGRDTFVMRNAEGLSGGEIIGAFVQQHYVRTNFVPPEILVSEQPADSALLTEWLTGKRGARVTLNQPQRGEKRRLVELVCQNAEEALRERRTQRERDIAATEGALSQLQTALGLPALPYRIEGFDVSHVQGADVVAAMVVFEGGLPKKADYRKFKMRQDRNDDFANMYEAVLRRFRRGLLEREALVQPQPGLAAEGGAAYGGNELVPRVPAGRKLPDSPKWSVFPDLLVIDGGKGQLNAALDALATLNLSAIPAFGLAKKEEELFAPGRKEPIILPRASDALFVLQRVRDETHRFAVTFHRQRHRKSTSRSVLDDAPGIGPKRKRELLRHFGSLRRIKQATVEELAVVPGMGREAAERLVEHLENLNDASEK